MVRGSTTAMRHQPLLGQGWRVGSRQLSLSLAHASLWGFFFHPTINNYVLCVVSFVILSAYCSSDTFPSDPITLLHFRMLGLCTATQQSRFFPFSC